MTLSKSIPCEGLTAKETKHLGYFPIGTATGVDFHIIFYTNGALMLYCITPE